MTLDPVNHVLFQYEFKLINYCNGNFKNSLNRNWIGDSNKEFLIINLSGSLFTLIFE